MRRKPTTFADLFGLILCVLVGAAAEQPEKTVIEYRLGPEDSLSVRVLEVEEIQHDRPIKIDNSGFIDLPLVGHLRAAGRTAPELEDEIAIRLRKFVHDPKVSVHVAEYRSQPVSVLGAVNTPGVHQLQGPKRLLEILSLAGGLRPDAGSTIQITRDKALGTLDISGAKTDESGKFVTAEIDLDMLLKGTSPASNILMLPHDVVSVTKADLVYVIGEVKKAGGFTLRAREQMTVLQALSLAEGLERTPASSHSKILRAQPQSGQRKEIPVNVSKILASQAPD